jgi:hypothetical protein
MQELDMSRPGHELFPESSKQEYNSYMDVNVDPGVQDQMSVMQPEVAQPAQLSDKEMNFRALRDEANRFKEEREYWKGQAEAYSRQQPSPQEPQQADAYSALDWDDSKDVQKAFHSIRQENDKLRDEMRDSLASIAAKTQHQDWNNMVTQHVPQLTSKNPIFAEMIQKASNPYEAAYLLAELNARASQPEAQQLPPMNGNAQRAIANSQKPQTLASVGGNGTLSSADYYASMSDEDFMKIAGRNLANI